MAFNSLLGTVMSKINNLTIIVKCQSVLSLLIDAFVSMYLVGSVDLLMCHLLFFSLQKCQ